MAYSIRKSKQIRKKKHKKDLICEKEYKVRNFYHYLRSDMIKRRDLMMLNILSPDRIYTNSPKSSLTETFLRYRWWMDKPTINANKTVIHPLEFDGVCAFNWPVV